MAWVVHLVPALLALPAAVTVLAHSRNVAAARRRFGAWAERLEAKGFTVHGFEPWRATGTYEGLPVAMNTDGANVDGYSLRCTRLFLTAPTGVERACIYRRWLRNLADPERLQVVTCEPELDKRYVATAADPQDFLERFGPDIQRAVAALDVVIWIDVRKDGISMAIDGQFGWSIARVLDCLDLMVAIHQKRPLGRIPPRIKARMSSYWGLAMVMVFVAFWLALGALRVPSVSRALSAVACADGVYEESWNGGVLFRRCAGARDPTTLPSRFRPFVVTYDVIYFALLGLVGILARARPLRPGEASAERPRGNTYRD